MESRESCVKLRLRALRPSTTAFRCAAFPFFPFPPAESAELFEGPCQVSPRRPLPNVLPVQSPIGLTRRSHDWGISDELKVITCDVLLSGITCTMLREGGCDDSPWWRSSPETDGWWHLRLLTWTETPPPWVRTAAGRARASTAHTAAVREGKKREEKKTRLRPSLLAAEWQEKIITPSWAVRGGEMPSIHVWVKTTGQFKCGHAWVGRRMAREREHI